MQSKCQFEFEEQPSNYTASLPVFWRRAKGFVLQIHFKLIVSVNKTVKKEEFSDILNSHGFKATSETGPNTINSLRKQVEIEDDPVKAKVSDE